MSIVIALIIFGLIVTVHEFGHFICAKLSGIRVLEFAIGMGPKIIQKKKGETMYSLRALPVGGYCAMEGEDAQTDDERGFRNAKLWKRVIVLAAGAFMNFVLGFLLLLVMSSMFDAVPTTVIKGFSGVRNDDDTVTYYAQSYETGLRHGDKIVKMDGTAIYSILDLNYMFATTDRDVHEVVVKRDGKRVTLDGVVFHDDQTGETLDFGLVTKDKNPLTVTGCASDIFKSMGHIVGMSLKQILTGKAKKEDVSGPVGVVTAINESTQESESTEDAIFNLIYMAALITINVGIFNLLPIPGLDGGRLLFCLIELIRRKPVKPEHEGYVHLAGMILLFGIMIFATYNDIVRLITGG
ncbi:RIP metalloprotease [Ruminococcus sp. XPD3002]|uniref:M50 family metallopeptidase n=1 Tax=Ruminococcus sp. XPD3002 TaxID=1452269 RepID=UPI00091E2F68|nr:regulator of sigma E protease [Ruminococcus flavefaciens]HPY84067.1 site-2 protease family protein [Ruminococcus flavefaciens]HRU95908.1 site-2 protease family protein [Ruminococcus sp.]